MIDFDAMTQKQEQIRRKRKAQETLRERATDTSVHITGMPHGGNGENQQERIRIEAIAAGEEADAAEKELEVMRRQLRREMKKLGKWQHADVIRKKYLEGKTISQTAMEIGYETAQTNRFLAEARALINQARAPHRARPKHDNA